MSAQKSKNSNPTGSNQNNYGNNQNQRMHNNNEDKIQSQSGPKWNQLVDNEENYDESQSVTHYCTREENLYPIL